MEINLLLQLFFAFAFIVLVCVMTLMFFAMGVISFRDFMEGKYLGLSRFFPLLFLNAGIMVYLGTVKPRLIK